MKPSRKLRAIAASPMTRMREAELGVAADRLHPGTGRQRRGRTRRRPSRGREGETTAQARRTRYNAAFPSSPKRPRGRISSTSPHHHIHHRFGRRGQVDGGEAGGDADHQPADQGPDQAPQSADDDGHEARHDERGADRRREPQQPRRQHAGETGEIDADAEIRLRSQRTLTPSVDTVSRSRVPARMRMPSLVWFRPTKRPPIASPTMTIMKTR